MDLDRITRMVASLDQIQVRSNACCRCRSPHARCNRCREVCPTNGISIVNECVRVDRCTQCGLCAAVCPNGVFHLPEGATMRLDAVARQMAGSFRELIVNCRREAAAAKSWLHGTAVPCLGSVSPELMLVALAEGLQKLHFFYRPSECSRCAITTGEKLFLQNLAGGSAWLRAVGSEVGRLQVFDDDGKAPEPLVRGERPGAERPANESRREFFGAVFQGLRQAPAVIVHEVLGPAKKPPGENALFQPGKIPARRQILLAALRKLEAQLCEQSPAPLPFLTVRGQCYYCGACARLCPTGALRISEECGAAELHVADARCTGCGLCVEVCFERSLALEQELPVVSLLSAAYRVLDVGKTRACPQCGEVFTGSQQAAGCLRCKILATRTSPLEEGEPR